MPPPSRPPDPNLHYRRRSRGAGARWQNNRTATHATRSPSPIFLPPSVLHPAVLQFRGTKCSSEDGVGGGGGGGENFPHRMAEGEQEREWGTGGESEASARALTDQRTELRVKQLQYFGVSTFSKRNVHLGFRVTLFQSALVLRYILSLSTTVTLSFE